MAAWGYFYGPTSQSGHLDALTRLASARRYGQHAQTLYGMRVTPLGAASASYNMLCML